MPSLATRRPRRWWGAAARPSAHGRDGSAVPAMGVPWYVHPAEEPTAWDWLHRRARDLSFVVVNVHDGPGRSDDPYYGPWLSRLRSLPLIGYVDLDYGRRRLGQVAADIRTWAHQYPVSGVMFDQVPTGSKHLTYLRACATEARAALGNCLVVANPGTDPHPEQLELFDVVCTFEGPASTYADYLPPPAVAGVDHGQIWHLVYDVDPSSIEDTRRRAHELGAGHAYVTAGRMPNPWDGPPTKRRRPQQTSPKPGP